MTYGAGYINSQIPGTYYLAPGFIGTAITSAPIQMAVPKSGFIKNMYVRQLAADHFGVEILYSVMVNGTLNPLNVGILSSDTDGHDTVDPAFHVNAGDLIHVEALFVLATRNPMQLVIVTFEFFPD